MVHCQKCTFFAQNVTENVPFWQLPEFFSKSSSSTPIFYSINQKMTSISSFTAIFTNFVGSVFAQLKLENSVFYKNRYFSTKSALYTSFKQQEGIKLHKILKMNISTTALNQFLAIQTVCKEMPLRQSKVLLVKMWSKHPFLPPFTS